ncbi:MAG: hypothetical protein II362_03195, partial [Alistipes sp.]|nr:hypothetical protein [Alistipes sp.]
MYACKEIRFDFRYHRIHLHIKPEKGRPNEFEKLPYQSYAQREKYRKEKFTKEVSNSALTEQAVGDRKTERGEQYACKRMQNYVKKRDMFIEIETRAQDCAVSLEKHRYRKYRAET